MTGKQSRIVNADDFRSIKGIGPVFAERIHKAGIQTYHELASMSPSQLAEKISGLSAKQITKQDWTGQAHKLAPKKTRSTSPPSKKGGEANYSSALCKFYN